MHIQSKFCYEYPLLAMHTLAGIKLHNIKYKNFFF